MATRFGRCINFGSCAKADSHENIPMPRGAVDVLCPEPGCGKPLAPVNDVPPPPPPSPILIGGVLVAVLILAFLTWRNINGRQPAGPSLPGPAAAAPGAQVTTDFALCGPRAVWSRLGADLVAGFLTALGAANPTVDAPSGDEQIVAGDVHGRKTAVRVATHDAASAFEGLQAGDCQVGMASRRIKPVEVINLRPLGNMLSPNAEHVIGLDGIAVIVNQANPVSSLSVSQLKDIFSGRVTSWSASGGSGTISVLGRDEKSPTFDTLDALVLDRAPLTSGALRFDDSGTLAAAVATRANAIAFTGLSSIGEAKALEITSGGLPIAPTALTVGRETYPLTRRLYLYTAPSPRNPLVTRFIAFAESSAGQKIVDRDGFIGSETSISTASSNARSLPSGAPLGYRRLVDGFDQAKFNFYFNTGSDVLDNKALVDVGRLVEDLSAEARRNKEIVLAGFADSTGDRALNVALSQDRAKSVARELESQGVHVKDTIGFGQELPISDNATEAGREKNRRVEIFVTR